MSPSQGYVTPACPFFFLDTFKYFKNISPKLQQSPKVTKYCFMVYGKFPLHSVGYLTGIKSLWILAR